MADRTYWVVSDPSPDDPNSHAWSLEAGPFPSEEEARAFGEREENDLRKEYGDEYARDSYRWLVISAPPRGQLYLDRKEEKHAHHL